MFETVSRSYSYRLILRSAIVLLSGAIVTALAVFFALNRNAGLTYAQSYNVMAALRHELLHKSLVIYASTSFFIMVGIALISLVYSHRVAGPLHRLGQAARRIASGDLSEPVKLRHNDVIHPLADDLNDLISSYSGILNTLELHVAELKEQISELPESEEALTAGKVSGAIIMVSEKTDEIRDTLSVIKL